MVGRRALGPRPRPWPCESPRTPAGRIHCPPGTPTSPQEHATTVTSRLRPSRHLGSTDILCRARRPTRAVSRVQDAHERPRTTLEDPHGTPPPRPGRCRRSADARHLAGACLRPRSTSTPPCRAPRPPHRRARGRHPSTPRRSHSDTLVTPDQATNPNHADEHRLAPTASGDRGNTGNHGVDLMRDADALLVEARRLQAPTARSNSMTASWSDRPAPPSCSAASIASRVSMIAGSSENDDEQKAVSTPVSAALPTSRRTSRPRMRRGSDQEGRVRDYGARRTCRYRAPLAKATSSSDGSLGMGDPLQLDQTLAADWRSATKLRLRESALRESAAARFAGDPAAIVQTAESGRWSRLRRCRTLRRSDGAEGGCHRSPCNVPDRAAGIDISRRRDRSRLGKPRR